MFAVIYIPQFSLQAVLREHSDWRAQPVVLIDGNAVKPIVLQASAAARGQGIVPGMTPSQAAARCATVLVKALSPAQERSATDILLQNAYAFSPNIESTASGVCTIDLRGLALDLPEAQRIWAEKIVRTFAGFALEAQVGFAETPELALLAARAAHPILLAKDAEELLESLPLSALEPSARTASILQLWGVRTVGGLIALGKENIAERLEEDALELFDRVSPDAVRPLNLVAPSENFSEHLEFEMEVDTLEPLLRVLQGFIEQLTRRLETIHLVAGELQLDLALASGEKYQRPFKIPAPTGDAGILFRTLRTHLETLRTASPIISVSLSATPANLQGHQFGFFERTLRNPNQFSETLARLTALLGSPRVGRPVLEPSYRSDVFRMEKPDFDAGQAEAVDASEKKESALRRFRPRIAAQIQCENKKPVSVESPVFHGVLRRVEGPYLSSGHWWEDATRWSRAEWDAEDAAGTRWLICQTNEGDFVEGVYD